MSATLKVGDRMHLTTGDHAPDYYPGDRGTVLWPATTVPSGETYYGVLMDREISGAGFLFNADEIELDCDRSVRPYGMAKHQGQGEKGRVPNPLPRKGDSP